VDAANEKANSHNKGKEGEKKGAKKKEEGAGARGVRRGVKCRGKLILHRKKGGKGGGWWTT